jgi:hypothetical protein
MKQRSLTQVLSPTITLPESTGFRVINGKVLLPKQ